MREIIIIVKNKKQLYEFRVIKFKMQNLMPIFFFNFVLIDLYHYRKIDRKEYIDREYM